MLLKKLIKSITLLAPAVSGLVQAAPTPPVDDPSRGGILQREIERQLPKQNLLPAPKPEAQKIKPNEAQPGQVSVVVKSFRFEGVTRVSESELKSALESWLNKTLTLEELNKSADAVAQYYQTKDQLAQAFIPPQKIEADGVVLIKVVEAKLGAVKVEEDGDARISKERLAKFITYKNPVGEYVNTKHIEESIYIVNELPGLAATTELASGERDGEVALKVKVADTGLVHGSVTMSNYGSSSTGNNQLLGNLSINNPLGIGDQLTLNAFKTDGTNYTQAGYSLPIHESGLRLSLTASNMIYQTVGMYAGSLGNANTMGVGLSYPLLRSQSMNANVTMNYDNKYYQNGLSTGVVNSEYTIDLWTIGISGNRYDGFFGGGVTTLSLSASFGRFKNPLWDDQSTSNYGQYAAPSFSKYNFGFTRNQQIIPDQTVLNVSISGQLAGNNLDPVERFYLGGPNGIRAYPQSQGAGDQGAMINIELQQQLPYGIIGYAFFDAGWVQQYKSESVYGQIGAANFKAANEYMLAGYGIGAKYTYSSFTVNGFVGIPYGDNPLYRYGGTTAGYVQQNSDGLSGQPYYWIQGVYKF